MANEQLPTAVLADVRSVLQIGAHFDGLKQRASQFLNDFAASERGFFTPTEDEQARQLLVSYWQSRNALLELVTACKDDNADHKQDPIRFLAAFGGALVLIDAARFIRDNMHDRSIVRAKLNEPEPHFGIPAGCYDQIQKSLTRPVHAWHLYHAGQLFESEEDKFREAAAKDTETQQLFELIDGLRDRLDVRVSRFATARARVQARQLRSRVQERVFGQALYGIQKAVSSLMADMYTRPKHVPALPTEIVAELQSLLAPGDVLVTRKEHAATNYFLPGYWPHAALYVGNVSELADLGLNEHENITAHWDEVVSIDAGQSGRVVESMKDGVRMRSLTTTLKCDAITVLRPKLSDGALKDVVGRAFFHVGKAYDFDFDFARSDRMVCTEVVYRAYEGVEQTEFELTKRAGRQTLAAEDIMRMALNEQSFEVAACYAPEKKEGLQRDGDAEVLLRETICG